MQRSVVVDILDNDTVVATFPEGKEVVVRLLKEDEELLALHEQTKTQIRENLSAKGIMMDLDFVTELVFTAWRHDRVYNHHGFAVESLEERRSRLTRLLYLYQPAKKKVKGGITDEDIQRARGIPVRSLIKVKMNVALCLWHHEKSPSLHVFKDNHCYCFGCSKRADSIDIAMQMNNMDFITAVKWLLKI